MANGTGQSAVSPLDLARLLSTNRQRVPLNVPGAGLVNATESLLQAALMRRAINQQQKAETEQRQARSQALNRALLAASGKVGAPANLASAGIGGASPGGAGGFNRSALAQSLITSSDPDLQEMGLRVALERPREGDKPAEFRTFFGPGGARQAARRGSPEAEALVKRGYVTEAPPAEPKPDIRSVPKIGLVDVSNPDRPRTIMAAPSEVPEGPKITDVAGLRKEYTKQSQPFIDASSSLARLEAAGDTAAGDLSLMFNYMKALDPGSVVRESEFATVAATGSLGERLQAGVQRVITGERLTPEMREDFRTQARQAVLSQIPAQRNIESVFTGIAERQGMNPSNVVFDVIKDLEEDFEGVAPEIAPRISSMSATGIQDMVESAGGLQNLTAEQRREVDARLKALGF